MPSPLPEPAPPPRVVSPPRRSVTPQHVGDYLVERRLGRGGMSEVHLARHMRTDRQVAVKHVPATGDPNHRRRLHREARTTDRIDHPAVVQVLDTVDDEDGLWLVMEYVDGITLYDEIHAAPLPVPRALDISRQIAEALAAAHDIGVLHRDLKSENVMLTPDGGVRLLDFGLAKALWDEQSQTLTVHGEVMGTCRAMSPEQARGRELDGRSDLFALGSLLYEMVTGLSPFQAPTPVETMNRVCTHQPTPAHLVLPDVPRSVSQLVQRLSAKRPEERPGDAHTARREIEEVAGRLLEGREWPIAPTAFGVFLGLLILAAAFLLHRFEPPVTEDLEVVTLGDVSRAPAAGAEDPGDAAIDDGLDQQALERAAAAFASGDLETARVLALPFEMGLDEGQGEGRGAPTRPLLDAYRLLAAVDFEGGFPEAARRWLDLAGEVATRLGDGETLVDQERRRLELWLEDGDATWESWTVVQPFGPGVACATWALQDRFRDEALLAPPKCQDAFSSFAAALELARRGGDAERLAELVEAARGASWPRLELRARQLRLRHLEGEERSAEAAALEEDARVRGLVRLAREARRLGQDAAD